MSYHYEVGTRFGFHHFETMNEARRYRDSFGGRLFIVMADGDRAEL